MPAALEALTLAHAATPETVPAVSSPDGKFSPTFLLDEEVAEHSIRYQTARIASDPRKAFQLLRDLSQQRREEFMLSRGLGALSEIEVIITLSNLLRMTRLLPPFSQCSRDEVNSSLESLIYDAVLERP